MMVVVVVVIVVVVEEVVQAKTSSPSRSVRAPTRNRTHVYLLDLISYGRRDITRKEFRSQTIERVLELWNFPLPIFVDDATEREPYSLLPGRITVNFSDNFQSLRGRRRAFASYVYRRILERMRAFPLSE
ncbi:uncharacterized protein V1477_017129 [Vespula maculifrons]|uniref:Secreted protein n=1 Tax=Vespula maculifrons TaxID=7453 RepID=A0ABD2B569_VESMC